MPSSRKPKLGELEKDLASVEAQIQHLYWHQSCYHRFREIIAANPRLRLPWECIRRLRTASQRSCGVRGAKPLWFSAAAVRLVRVWQPW